MLSNHQFASALGWRGYERLLRRYTLERCVESYAGVITDLIGEVQS